MAPPLVAAREDEDSDGEQTTGGSISSSMESTTQSMSVPSSLSPPELIDPKTGVTVQLIGKSCGQHGSCVFYKGLTFRRPKPSSSSSLSSDSSSANNRKNVTDHCSELSSEHFTYLLGDFFLMKLSPQSHVCIGAIQLLWEDKQRKQLLASIKVYFLPEKTPEGRQSTHGEHELIAARGKVTLRLTDLVSWIVTEPTTDWNVGAKVWLNRDCVDESLDAKRIRKAFLNRPSFYSEISSSSSSSSCSTSSATSSLHRSLDFSDVISHKKESCNYALSSVFPTIVVRSYGHYCRWKCNLKRLTNNRSSLNPELGFAESQYRFAVDGLNLVVQPAGDILVLFCRETFEHRRLDKHKLNCNSWAPQFKGRPRKKALSTAALRASSPDSISSEENVGLRRSKRANTSASTLASINLNLTKKSVKRGRRKSNESSSEPPATPNEDNNKSQSSKSTTSATCSPNKPKNNKKRYQKKKAAKESLSTSETKSVDNNNNVPLNDQSNFNHDRLRNQKQFIDELYKFMKKRKTPIVKVPNLGFKKVDLYDFYWQAQTFGGYEKIKKERSWKKLFQKLGGDKKTASAATETRKRYESLLLPFERHLRGLPDIKIEKRHRDTKTDDSLALVSESNTKSPCSEDVDDDDEAETETEDMLTDELPAVTSIIKQKDHITNGDDDRKPLPLTGDATSGCVDGKEQPVVKSEPNAADIVKRESAWSDDRKTPTPLPNETNKILSVNKNRKQKSSFSESKENLPGTDLKNVDISQLSQSTDKSSKLSNQGTPTDKPLNFGNKVTALVHPTQRVETDVYDFTLEESEIPIKNVPLKNNIHSNDATKNNRFMPVRPLSDDFQFQNSSFRKAFSLPKALESPDKIIMNLKKHETNHELHEPIENAKASLPLHIPRPAHLKPLNQHKNEPTIDKPAANILDLSTRKRSIDESDELSGDTIKKIKHENVLDLSVRRQATPPPPPAQQAPVPPQLPSNIPVNHQESLALLNLQRHLNPNFDMNFASFSTADKMRALKNHMSHPNYALSSIIANAQSLSNSANNLVNQREQQQQQQQQQQKQQEQIKKQQQKEQEQQKQIQLQLQKQQLQQQFQKHQQQAIQQQIQQHEQIRHHQQIQKQIQLQQQQQQQQQMQQLQQKNLQRSIELQNYANLANDLMNQKDIQMAKLSKTSPLPSSSSHTNIIKPQPTRPSPKPIEKLAIPVPPPNATPKPPIATPTISDYNPSLPPFFHQSQAWNQSNPAMLNAIQMQKMAYMEQFRLQMQMAAAMNAQQAPTPAPQPAPPQPAPVPPTVNYLPNMPSKSVPVLPSHISPLPQHHAGHPAFGSMYNSPVQPTTPNLTPQQIYGSLLSNPALFSSFFSPR